MSKRLYVKRREAYRNSRDRVLNGLVNCIPFPFDRFRKQLPGIQQALYYLISGNQKSGKSQIADYLFCLHPLMYAFMNKEKVRVKIFYFSLEMSIQEKYDQFTCWWLYMQSQGKVRIDTKELNSLDPDKPVSEDILALLETEEYIKFFDFIEDNVMFYEHIKNPTGIYKTLVNYAVNHGTIKYKTVQWRNENTGEMEDKKVIDTYEMDDSEEYRIAITDHYGLLGTEGGMDLRKTIQKYSANDSVYLRKTYKYTMVGIQQQAADKEGNEAFKLNRLTPSPDGLGDNKATSRDCNVMLGIFSPFRHEKSPWQGYNINDFKDNIRFLEVCLNRNGGAGAVAPLYFDGAVNAFFELPPPGDVTNLEIYKQMAYKAQNRN